MALWKSIPGFSRYEASDTGLLRRAKDGGTGTTKKHRIVGVGGKGKYVPVDLTDDNGLKKMYRRSRIIALAFLGPPPSPEYQIDHINGIKDDDRPSNLEWVTPKENIRRSWEKNPEARRKAASQGGKKGGQWLKQRLDNDPVFRKKWIKQCKENARRLNE